MTIDSRTRKALEAAGWWIGDAEDFLGLDAAERQLVEFRVRVARGVRRVRESRGLTQRQVAALMKSTQARVAKIEAAAPEVSLDLMLRGYFAIEGTLGDLIEGPTRSPRGRRPSRREPPAAKSS